jgi:hypothetical protein
MLIAGGEIDSFLICILSAGRRANISFALGRIIASSLRTSASVLLSLLARFLSSKALCVSPLFLVAI